jgi:aminoglycoside/choline kinase family phosphotransferase
MRRPAMKIASHSSMSQNCFVAAGANTPEMLAENLAEGFLLLSDFGDTTYLRHWMTPAPTASIEMPTTP